jgi:hypothetical protein
MATDGQQFNKHAPMAKDMHTTIEEMLDAVLSIQSMLWLFSVDHREKFVSDEG